MTIKRFSLIISFWLLSNSITSQTKTFDFFYNSGKKSPNNLNIFKDSLSKWQKTFDIRITFIRGFADSIGSESGNYNLSRKRALRIDSILKTFDIQTKNLRLIANGEKHPVFSNSTQIGRSKNRRVQVTLELSNKIIQKNELAPILEVVKEKPKKDCEENDTIIVLPEGTEIELKGCSLDGLSLKDIKVDAEEYFTKDKMILNDMFTQTTDGTCLSTGGMLRLKITDKLGNPVRLKPNNDVTIRIPKTTADTAYSVYEMKQDKDKENVGWEKRDEPVKYLKDKNKFEVKLTTPTISMNLDFPPSVVSAIAKRKYILKTRVVKNGKSYFNGSTSVIKLNRIKPKKFKFKKIQCIPGNELMVTVVAKRNGKILYCHKNIKDLKVRTFINKKYIVRKKDYLTLDNKTELTAQLKKDFGVK